MINKKDFDLLKFKSDNPAKYRCIWVVIDGKWKKIVGVKKIKKYFNEKLKRT